MNWSMDRVLKLSIIPKRVVNCKGERACSWVGPLFQVKSYQNSPCSFILCVVCGFLVSATAELSIVAETRHFKASCVHPVIFHRQCCKNHDPENSEGTTLSKTRHTILPIYRKTESLKKSRVIFNAVINGMHQPGHDWFPSLIWIRRSRSLM